MREANELLQKYFPDSEYIVDSYTLKSDVSKRFVFTTTDRTKIIKIIKDSPSFNKGIETYERLSHEETGCKICKLVISKKTDDGRIIIVMENCGEDLVDFLDPKKRTITLMQLLQLSSELLKQIICLQNPPDGGAGVVHGDIKLENVAVKVEGESLNVRLIDFDGSNEILEQDGKLGVNLSAFTPWFVKGFKMSYTSQCITNLVSSNVPFIEKFLKFKIKKPNIYFNVPNVIGGQLLDKPKSPVLGSLDYLHIIDLCSWSYIVAIVLKVYDTIRLQLLGLFVYNTLFVVVMNILLPNYNEPRDPPVDCFGRPINKEYCDKVVNGLSVLSRLLSESYVSYHDYSHSTAKLFVDLIHTCSTEDELYTRFTTIVRDNVDFYKKRVEFTDVAAAAAAFDTVTRHIDPAAGVVDAGSADGHAGKGGRTRRRRRRTYKKTYRTCVYKKNKKASKIKRIKNKTKLNRS